MNSNTVSLMTAEDLELIQLCGGPAQPSDTYVHCGVDGGVTLTERGRRLYRMACLLNEMCPEPVEDVRDVEGLRDLSLKIKRVRLIFRLDELERARRNGKVPAKARAIIDAMLFGTHEALRAAVERRLMCELAGDNVIPGYFGTRRSAVDLDRAETLVLSCTKNGPTSFEPHGSSSVEKFSGPAVYSDPLAEGVTDFRAGWLCVVSAHSPL